MRMDAISRLQIAATEPKNAAMFTNAHVTNLPSSSSALSASRGGCKDHRPDFNAVRNWTTSA